jgi:GNAT superfamily N-acetyltransferase
VRYPKECVLKDCREAIIRRLAPGDKKLLAQFYEKIPAADRWYMRYDATHPDVLHRWFEGLESGFVDSIVAVCGACIVGHGSLHMRGFGVTQHVGRLRIVVLPEYRRQRLGTWLMLDLVQLAMDKGLEVVRTDLVSGIEDAAIEAAQKLDFFKGGVLGDYAKDHEGKRRDIVIMLKHLHNGWSDY